MREVERDKKLRRREYIFIYKILDTLLSYKESSRASPVSGWPIVPHNRSDCAGHAGSSRGAVRAARRRRPPVIEVESETVSLGDTNAVTVSLDELDDGDAWEVLIRRESDDGRPGDRVPDGGVRGRTGGDGGQPGQRDAPHFAGLPGGRILFRGPLHRDHIGSVEQLGHRPVRDLVRLGGAPLSRGDALRADRRGEQPHALHRQHQQRDTDGGLLHSEVYELAAAGGMR